MNTPGRRDHIIKKLMAASGHNFLIVYSALKELQREQHSNEFKLKEVLNRIEMIKLGWK